MRSADNSFIDALMKQIMGLVMIPKFQVERAIGPILGIFITELLSKSLGNRLVMVCPEFPLRKDSDSYQTTNIDWLLYSSTLEQLVFVELKTTDTTFDPAQARTYLRAIQRVKEGQWPLLVKDVEEIGYKSLERGKYKEVLSLLEPCAKCKDARLVYLTPKVMKDAECGRFDPSIKWLCFEELEATLTSDYASEWAVIRGLLGSAGQHHAPKEVWPA